VSRRYAPPSSKVDDVVPDQREPFRVRTVWLFVGVTALLSATLAIAEHILEQVSPLTLGISLALAVLLCAWPSRMLSTLRSVSIPLWLNVLTYAVIALVPAGAFMEEDMPLAVGYLALLGYSASVVVMCWITESRAAVKVYSTANAFVVVGKP
jgi:hypothetical protein